MFYVKFKCGNICLSGSSLPQISMYTCLQALYDYNVCQMHFKTTSQTFLQMVMAVFAYIYHQSFITPQSVSVEMILDQVKL